MGEAPVVERRHVLQLRAVLVHRRDDSNHRVHWVRLRSRRAVESHVRLRQWAPACMPGRCGLAMQMPVMRRWNLLTPQLQTTSVGAPSPVDMSCGATFPGRLGAAPPPTERAAGSKGTDQCTRRPQSILARAARLEREEVDMPVALAACSRRVSPGSRPSPGRGAGPAHHPGCALSTAFLQPWPPGQAESARTRRRLWSFHHSFPPASPAHREREVRVRRGNEEAHAARAGTAATRRSHATACGSTNRRRGRSSQCEALSLNDRLLRTSDGLTRLPRRKESTRAAGARVWRRLSELRKLIANWSLLQSPA